MQPGDKAPVVTEVASTPLGPATYKLVGIKKGVTEVYIPLLQRSYTIKQLTDNLGLLELLDRLGWDKVQKTI
ncbi:hypothetical protein [Spirosoma oryzicola]|uniref:hypothetical protein n=1 Tax=Spirosoma oryzicola TaxID=2898794 RepID=UPI001E29C118|nr:hypothetical protein [Spirosoma oryzicola]UHG93445.1 hypothetical protein LQ777_11185 [Spirosoma oryzicola]